MNLAIFTENLWVFYVALELLGIISTLFVMLESGRSAPLVFAFNKFASLIFLTGCVLPNTRFGAICLLVGCLCKTAQLPFSLWLIRATEAHIVASIFIHSATIVGVGAIFVTRFRHIFDAFPETYSIMTFFGSVSAIAMPVVALFCANIKKIIACLSVSSAGLMLVCCGIRWGNISIAYFVGNAFFKSALFLVLAQFAKSDINRVRGVPRPLFFGLFVLFFVINCLIPAQLFWPLRLESLLSAIVLVKLFIQTASNSDVKNPIVWLVIFAALPFLCLACWAFSVSLDGKIGEFFLFSVIYFVFKNQKRFTLPLPIFPKFPEIKWPKIPRISFKLPKIPDASLSLQLKYIILALLLLHFFQSHSP